MGREGSLTVEEEWALRELKVNQNIVIKPADKGSKIVIMDKQQYRLEAQRQLGNEKYYKCKFQIQSSPRCSSKLGGLSTHYITRVISTKQCDYFLGPDDPRPRLSYSEIPPGRPIVSDCSGAIHNISQYTESPL